MLRREFIASLAAGSVLDAPATDGSQTPGMSSVSVSRDPERGDWYPHQTVDIEKDGRATVSLTLRGGDPPEKVELINRWVKNLEFTSGQEALTLYDSGNLWTWNPTVSDTLEYTLSLGHHGPNAGSFSTTVRDGAVLSATNEILPVIDWKDGIDRLPSGHRYTVNPPDDWSVALPGTLHGANTFEAVPSRHFVRFPTNHFVVGDFSVHSSTNEAVDARAIALPSAEEPSGSELLSLLEDTIPLLESRFGEETTHGRLGIVVPAEVEEGGQALDQSFLLNERNSLAGRTHSVAIHELAHTFQRFGDPRWHQEGMVSYLANLLLYEVGRISESDFYERLRKYTTGPDRFTVGQPYGVPAAEEPYKKGAGVYAALDVDLRARTDGEADIGAFIAGVNDQRTDGRVIVRSEALARLYSATDIDYSDFFRRFVDGTEFPSEILEEDFSITDPGPIGFAAFNYPEIVLSNKQLVTGDELAVTVEARNVGSLAGERNLELVAGGESVATESINLSPGESTEITFQHVFTLGGQYQVSIPPTPGQTVTVDDGLEISNASVSSAQALPGETVTVAAEVQNTSNSTRTTKVALQDVTDDASRVLAASEVELEPGESATVSIEHVFESPGEYRLALNGREVDTVRITEPDGNFTIKSEIPDDIVPVGREVSIRVSVIFHDAGSGGLSLELFVGGDSIDQASVSVEDYTTKTVTFAHKFDQPGEFPISVVDGAEGRKIRLGTVTVEAEQEATTSSDTQSTPTPEESADPGTPVTTAVGADSTETPGQPGFGVISAIAGVGSAVGYLIYGDRSDERSKRE